MDSSDTESDAPPMSPEPRKKRPVPVKALEALAKARETKAKQREETAKAKAEMKAKKEEAVKVVDQVRNEMVAPAVPAVAPAAVPSTDYIKTLEEKLHALESKLVKPKKVKKKVIIEESDSSSEEEVVIKRKPAKKTAPASAVDDSTINAFREFQMKQLAMQQNADKEKAEKDRLRALFTRF